MNRLTLLEACRACTFACSCFSDRRYSLMSLTVESHSLEVAGAGRRLTSADDGLGFNAAGFIRPISNVETLQQTFHFNPFPPSCLCCSLPPLSFFAMIFEYLAVAQ
jgi:hypothetical protein